MEEKIKAFLQSKLPEVEGLTVSGLNKMTEGFSYETFSFKVKWFHKGQEVEKDLVLRMEPEAGVVEPYDIRPQYWALKALEATPVPVPKVYWLEVDRRYLERPFFIMELVEGEIPIPWGFQNHECYRDPVKKRQMGRQLVWVLAQLHRVDWRGLGLDRYLELPPEGQKPAQREIDRWWNNLERCRLGPEPILAEARLWLQENAPATERLTLVHGDYRLGNFIWRDERIVAFLDWEMVGIGDPMSDLAWLCMKDWSPVEPDRVCNLLDKREVYDYYQELTGIEVKEECIFYWTVLSHFKLAVIIICGVRAFIDKKNADLRLLTLNSLYDFELRELIDLLGF